MSVFFTETDSVLDGNFSHPFGLGFECELIQRAAKAQIIKFLPELISQQQSLWDDRDKEFIEKIGGSFSPIEIPNIEEENIRSGIENMSLIEAPLDRWPSVLIYARNAVAYSIQEDQFDTSNISLFIEVLCKEGPVQTEEETHGKQGLKLMEILDSKIQRLTDAVYMCIRKDTTLSGTVGQFEKPPKVTTSLPWARKEDKTATGANFILQGKQLEFTVQKITL